MEAMPVLLVLGHKLLPDGRMSEPFKDYCERAVRYCEEHPSSNTTIVVSVGNTVKGQRTEAEAGTEYVEQLRAGRPSGDVVVVCVPEPTARTTPENISATIAMLEARSLHPTVLVIFGRRPQLARVRAILFRRKHELERRVGLWWRNINSVPGRNDNPFVVDMVEYLVFVPHDLLFPCGNSALYQGIVP
jgi:hypothetical protein